jgi:multiple sugar transport system permease protein
LLADFSLLELILYVTLWGVIGGLPAFYLFFAINRNPRTGARVGVVCGAIVGLGGALVHSINSAETMLNAALLLWLGVLLLWLGVHITNIGFGHYIQRVSFRQRLADLAYGLLLPTFVIVIAIVVFPMIWNFVLAFRPVRLRDLPTLRVFALDDLTLDNFNRMLSTRGFIDTLLRTLVYTVSGTVLAIMLGLIAALIVRDQFRGRNIVRGFMLFPYVAPIVSVVFVWQFMLNAQYGLINNTIGIKGFDYLTAPDTAFLMIVLFQAWRYFPFAFLFILARIQAIPQELYEAARVDGALPSQRLRFITLPQLQAVFATLFLLRFIWTFNKFDDVYLLTGGTSNTQVITIEIFNQLFSRSNVGTASAVAVIMALVLFVAVGVYFRLLATEEN